MLEYKDNFLCRVRAKSGAVGFSFGNSQMHSLYPIFVKRLQLFFIGKNALHLESLLDEAIRIGKIMQEYNFDFYEEPVPFDWYEETRQVSDALEI